MPPPHVPFSNTPHSPAGPALLFPSAGNTGISSFLCPYGTLLALPFPNALPSRRRDKARRCPSARPVNGTAARTPFHQGEAYEQRAERLLPHRHGRLSRSALSGRIPCGRKNSHPHFPHGRGGQRVLPRLREVQGTGGSAHQRPGTGENIPQRGARIGSRGRRSHPARQPGSRLHRHQHTLQLYQSGGSL